MSAAADLGLANRDCVPKSSSTDAVSSGALGLSSSADYYYYHQQGPLLQSPMVEVAAAAAGAGPGGSDLDSPPYAINNQNARAPLGLRTVPMSALHSTGPSGSGSGDRFVPHYHLHNLFGFAEAQGKCNGSTRTLGLLRWPPCRNSIVLLHFTDVPPPRAVTFSSAARLHNGTRPFLLSRSLFTGAGRFTSHWSGDNAATWMSLQQSIPQAR